MMNLSYPACVGRNMEEIVRCMRALQLSYNKAIATPADWPNNHSSVCLPDGTTTSDYKGAVFLLPAVTPEEAAEHYPDYKTCNVPSKKQYLRLVRADDVGDVPIQKVNKDIRGKWQAAMGRYKPKKKNGDKCSLYQWIRKLFGGRKRVAKKPAYK